MKTEALQKAIELRNLFLNDISFYGQSGEEMEEDAIKQAKKCVNVILSMGHDSQCEAGDRIVNAINYLYEEILIQLDNIEK